MAVQRSSVSGVPGRYALALFELAKEGDLLERVADDLAGFEQALDESQDLTRLVRSPVYSAGDQIRALDALFGRMGLAELTANFVKLVARNRRLFAIRDMIGAYRTLLADARGEIAAQVISAEPLSDAQVERIKAALKDSVGRDVQLATSVDPAILGGLIVKVGSRMVDNSLRTKLQSLKIAMKEA